MDSSPRGVATRAVDAGRAYRSCAILPKRGELARHDDPHLHGAGQSRLRLRSGLVKNSACRWLCSDRYRAVRRLPFPEGKAERYLSYRSQLDRPTGRTGMRRLRVRGRSLRTHATTCSTCRCISRPKLRILDLWAFFPQVHDCKLEHRASVPTLRDVRPLTLLPGMRRKKSESVAPTAAVDRLCRCRFRFVPAV